MTTQAPRNDVGPDNTIVWEPTHPAEEQPAGKRLIWPLVAAVVGGVLSSRGSFTPPATSPPVTRSPGRRRSPAWRSAASSRSEAIEKLSVELGARAAEPLNLTVGDKEAQLKPADAGLAVDYAQERRRGWRRQEPEPACASSRC